MNFLKLFIAVTFFIMASGLVAGVPEKHNEGTRKLRLEIKTQQTFYIVGEPVVLELLLHNDGEDDINFKVPGFLEDFVTIALKHDEKDAFKEMQREKRLYGLKPIRRYQIKSKGNVRLRLVFNEFFRLNKLGEYKGTLKLEIPGQRSMKADFKVIVMQPLDRIALTLYESWQNAKSIEEMRMAAKLLSYVHGNSAIKYLRKVITNDDADDEDRKTACDGLARIESKASVSDLATLAEDKNIPERISYYCKVLCVELHKSTKNEEIKKITKEVAEKYPNARRGEVID